MQDTKIFTDTDEEITFIVEKIKQASTNNVVLIVPDRASIFVTSASLRLLKKSIDRLDKKVVIVTMDEPGRKMCAEIGFTTAYRVRDVQPEIWSQISKYRPQKKESMNSVQMPVSIPDSEQQVLDQVHEEVLDTESLQTSEESVIPNMAEKFEFRKTSQPTEYLHTDPEPDPTQHSLVDEQLQDFQEPAFVPDPESIEEILEPIAPLTSDFVFSYGENVASAGPKKKFQKKIENFGFVAPVVAARGLKQGTDADEAEDVATEHPDDDVEKIERIKKNMTPKRDYLALFSAGFINAKDFVMSKLPNKNSNSNNTTNRRIGNPAISGSIRNKQSRKFNKKMLLIPGIALLVIILILAWYLYYAAPNIRITANLQNKSVKVNQDVVAKFGASDGVIGYKRAETVSVSDSAPATGTSKIGTAATGSVRMTYLQASGTITIPTNTLMTCSNITDCGGKALNFKTLTAQSFSITSPATVNIIATDIGPDYNLKSGTKFRVNGVAESDLSVTNLSPFTGGTSQDTKTISQADFDTLKAKLTDALKSQATDKITAALGSDVVILSNKINVAVTNVKPDKNPNDPGDILNMTLDGSVTAIGYNRTSVRPLAESLLKQQEKENLQLDLTSITYKETVKTSDDKSITLGLEMSGVLKPIVDKAKLVDSLLGKSLNDVNSILSKTANLSGVQYIYQPSWAPDFLKHVPFSGSNVNMELYNLNPVGN